MSSEARLYDTPHMEREVALRASGTRLAPTESADESASATKVRNVGAWWGAVRQWRTASADRVGRRDVRTNGAMRNQLKSDKRYF